MKSLIGITAATLMTVATSIASPAKAQELDPGAYDRSAPRIVSVSSTNVNNPRVYDATHTITLYSGAQPLRAITLNPIRGVEFDDIDVEADDIEVDFEGRVDNIPAKVYQRGRFMVIEFARPVPPLTTFEVEVEDVGSIFPFSPAGLISYEVNGYHVGLAGPIPYGLARVQSSVVN